jgi:hypothetical protein
LQKLITLIVTILLAQATQAAKPTEDQPTASPDLQVSKKALNHLIKNKILVINPEDKSLRFNLEEDTSRSLLEELNEKGLLNEEVSEYSPWCW